MISWFCRRKIGPNAVPRFGKIIRMGQNAGFKPSRQHGKYRRISCHKDRKNWVTSRNGPNFNNLNGISLAQSSHPFILPQIYRSIADIQKTKRRVGTNIIYIRSCGREWRLELDGVIGVFGAAKDGLKDNVLNFNFVYCKYWATK